MPNTENTTPPQTAGAPGSTADPNAKLDTESQARLVTHFRETVDTDPHTLKWPVRVHAAVSAATAEEAAEMLEMLAHDLRAEARMRKRQVDARPWGRRQLGGGRSEARSLLIFKGPKLSNQ